MKIILTIILLVSIKCCQGQDFQTEQAKPLIINPNSKDSATIKGLSKIDFSKFEPNPDTIAIKFTDVVKIDSVKKRELYIRAKTFFVDYYKDSKNVLEIDDENTGQIIGKGSFKFHSNVPAGSPEIEGYVTYKIAIYIKEGRYKYEITNFYHTGATIDLGLLTESPKMPGNPSWDVKSRDDTWNDLRNQAKEQTKIAIANLKKAMLKPSVGSQNNW